ELGRHQEAANAHPKPICEGGKGQRNDEVGKERGHQHYQGLGGDEIQEQPHDPGEEGRPCGLKVGQPIGYDGEENGEEN
ncbi:MAG: hypothetical protein Q9187_005321, partial [Circinaria calcarea]